VAEATEIKEGGIVPFLNPETERLDQGFNLHG